MKNYVSVLQLVKFFLFTLWIGFSPIVSAKEPGNIERGGALWSENCTRCHNSRSVTDLSDSEWITAVSHMRVRAGLTGQEARDILAFLQGMNDSSSFINIDNSSLVQTDSMKKLSGSEIYSGNCVACHGANGKGAIAAVPDFTNKKGPLLKTDEELIKNIINGYKSEGSNMAMPAKGGNAKLSEKDVVSVLEFIREKFSE